jgi:hypothetical protein
MRLARPGLAQYYIDRHLIDTANSLADRASIMTGNRRLAGIIHLRFICTVANCHNEQHYAFLGLSDIREPQHDRPG